MKNATQIGVAERSPSQRLRDELNAIDVKHNRDVPTASELCERAGISRNALYRYHRDILSELHKLQENIHRSKSDNSQQKLTQLKEENSRLKKDIDKMAALVDHYFTAWQECSVVVKRQDRDLANLRSNLKQKVTVL